MGFIWDLIQQGQIGDARQRAATLEQRVERLEGELLRTNDMVIRRQQRSLRESQDALRARCVLASLREVSPLVSAFSAPPL